MNPRTRYRCALALALSIVSSLAVATAAPAGATEDAPTCQTLLQTTPGIEVDTNDDGYPEYRAPRIHDVTLCSETGVTYVTHPPRIENCSDVPRSLECMAVRIAILPAYADAQAYAELCFTIEGDYAPTCNPINAATDFTREPQVACIGYDLNGEHPCDGSVFAFL